MRQRISQFQLSTRDPFEDNVRYSITPLDIDRIDGSIAVARHCAACSKASKAASCSQAYVGV